MSENTGSIGIRDSILLTVKKLSGVHEDYDHFNDDLIIHTNTLLFEMNQIGIGVDGFSVDDETALWSDFLTGQQVNLHALKTWLGLKASLIFDPPTSASRREIIKEVIKEYEWRLYITENYTDADMEEHYG